MVRKAWKRRPFGDPCYSASSGQYPDGRQSVMNLPKPSNGSGESSISEAVRNFSMLFLFATVNTTPADHPFYTSTTGAAHGELDG